MKPEQTRNITQMLMILLTGILLGNNAYAAKSPRPDAVTSPAIFAQVGDTVIFLQDFEAAFAGAIHKKFFHGKIPDGAATALRREVGNNLITNILLLNEAKRRGLKPDNSAVQNTIQQFEQRYRDNKQWQQNRDQILPSLTKQLTEENLLSKLEEIVRNIPSPDTKQIDEYYATHSDKFTEPEQLRISVILLKVDPSSPSLAWDKAREKGQALVKQVHAGSNFSALAKKYSDDTSAVKGGDMGYLHRGMLPQVAQEYVDKLKLGEVSEPVKLLEGIAIMQLNDRKSPKLGKFDTVKERARDLLVREQGDRAWESLIVKIKLETPVHVDESRYLSIPTTPTTATIMK